MRDQARVAHDRTPPAATHNSEPGMIRAYCALLARYTRLGLPQHVLPTLGAIAARTNPDGTGACGYVEDYATETGQSVRTVQRHLRILEKLGAIKEGDPLVAADRAENRRPMVWDLSRGYGELLERAGLLWGDTHVTSETGTNQDGPAQPSRDAA